MRKVYHIQYMMAISFTDLHNDAPTTMSVQDLDSYVRDARDRGVKILLSIWTTEMVDPIPLVTEVATKYPLFHIEDAHFLNSENIDKVCALKPFSVGLVWNENNNVAGGAYGDGDLTDWGRVVIERLVKAGVVIDLAHLNKKSFYSVLEHTKKLGGRVFCSHTCFFDVNPHPRNIDRDQIRAIIECVGIVGLTLVPVFLNGTDTAQFDDVLSHIRWFVENFGDDNLAIGTDFNGTDHLPVGLESYEGFVEFEKHLTTGKIFYKNAERFITYNN